VRSFPCNVTQRSLALALTMPFMLSLFPPIFSKINSTRAVVVVVMLVVVLAVHCPRSYFAR
jgi:hypothetical protein